VSGVTYNPASQVVPGTQYLIIRHRGLNQLTTAGATALGYDGRGNLTSSGATTYGYTSENRLATGNGAQLAYDSTGRLSAVDTATQSTGFDYAGNYGDTCLFTYLSAPALMSHLCGMKALARRIAAGSTRTSAQLR
jgi:hypothetical protein